MFLSDFSIKRPTATIVLIVAMMAIKTRISKDEAGIWAYPAVLVVYGACAAIFARKQKLAPKIKKQIQRVRS